MKEKVDLFGGLEASVLLCSPGCPWSCWSPVSASPECWNNRPVPTHPAENSSKLTKCCDVNTTMKGFISF